MIQAPSVNFATKTTATVIAVAIAPSPFSGGLAARVGGARVTVGAIRVTFWGALAMAVTAGVGALFGTVA